MLFRSSKSPGWGSHGKYRVRPTPAVMGSVTMRGRGTREYGFFPEMCSSEFKMTCTFPTSDGQHVPGVYTSPDGLQIVIEVAK